VKTITLWQPWASLVAIGVKRFETRHWSPPDSYTGECIAIRAAARPVPRDALGDLYDPCVDAFGLYDWHLRIPRGVVVCTAVLAGAYRVGGSSPLTFSLDLRLPRSADLPTLAVDAWGDFSPGRWLWLLTEVEKLNPLIAARGAQGFWEWRS
jgi:hypothetical protein